MNVFLCCLLCVAIDISLIGDSESTQLKLVGTNNQIPLSFAKITYPSNSLISLTHDVKRSALSLERSLNQTRRRRQMCFGIWVVWCPDEPSADPEEINRAINDLTNAVNNKLVELSNAGKHTNDAVEELVDSVNDQIVEEEQQINSALLELQKQVTEEIDAKLTAAINSVSSALTNLTQFTMAEFQNLARSGNILQNLTLTIVEILNSQHRILLCSGICTYAFQAIDQIAQPVCISSGCYHLDVQLITRSMRCGCEDDTLNMFVMYPYVFTDLPIWNTITTVYSMSIIPLLYKDTDHVVHAAFADESYWVDPIKQDVYHPINALLLPGMMAVNNPEPVTEYDITTNDNFTYVVTEYSALNLLVCSLKTVVIAANNQPPGCYVVPKDVTLRILNIDYHPDGYISVVDGVVYEGTIQIIVGTLTRWTISSFDASELVPLQVSVLDEVEVDFTLLNDTAVQFHLQKSDEILEYVISNPIVPPTISTDVDGGSYDTLSLVLSIVAIIMSLPGIIIFSMKILSIILKNNPKTAGFSKLW